MAFHLADARRVSWEPFPQGGQGGCRYSGALSSGGEPPLPYFLFGLNTVEQCRFVVLVAAPCVPRRSQCYALVSSTNQSGAIRQFLIRRDFVFSLHIYASTKCLCAVRYHRPSTGSSLASTAARSQSSRMGESIRRGAVEAAGALAAVTFQAGSRGGGSGYLERRGNDPTVCISLFPSGLHGPCMHDVARSTIGFIRRDTMLCRFSLAPSLSLSRGYPPRGVCAGCIFSPITMPCLTD